MRIRLLPMGLAFLVFNSSASAAIVQLGLQDPNMNISNRVSESAYRLRQGGWDQMLSNGSVTPTASDMTEIDYTGATALNGTSWDFSLSYESGDDGIQGFTFEMIQVGGPRSGSLTFDLNNPLNGQTPAGPFNAIKIEANAGSLLNPTSYDETAFMDITNLNFSSALPASGIFENPLDASTPSPGNTDDTDSTWVLSSLDLSLVDWTLTGSVNAGFDCNGMGSAGCLEEDSVRMNLLVANANFGSNVIPIPAAIWLFGSALAGLWIRRKQSV